VTTEKDSLVILCHYFWPEEMATAEMVSGVFFELARNGMKVSAVAGQPAYRNAGSKLPTVMEKDGIQIRRVWSTQFDKNNPLGRVLNTGSFAVSSTVACIAHANAGGFLAVTNPPLLPWVAAFAGKIRRRPYFILIHDVYPHIVVALGKMKGGSFIEKLWHRLNRWAYRGAEGVIVLGECMAEVIRAELPPDMAGKVTVIPNWADGNLIKPMPAAENPLIRELGLQDKFVVQYSGNIGLFHEIQTIARTAERLKEHPEIHFLIIGDGGQLPWLKRFVDEKGLRNVTLLPFQPKEKLPETLTACHVGFVALKEEATGLCVPSKLYGVLASGKAVVGIMNEKSEVAQTIIRNGCGVIVPPGDDEKVATAVLDLAKDAYKTDEMGKRSRSTFENEYSLEVTARLYDKVLRMK
jgi:glycosyltransferase involved in cell wall biosynthesis